MPRIGLPVPPEIQDRIERLEIPFNNHGLDHYGTSKRYLTRFFTMLRWLYRNYFTVRCYGVEHVPPRGRAMIVGNHSGGVALDGALIWASMFLEMDPPRLAQGMAEKFLAGLPYSAKWTAGCGQLTGLPEHAVRLLEDDRLLMVFPEGARGTAKLYPQRHSLVSFGTGFMRLALQTNTPIVPTAFIGSGDAIPTIFNSKTIGKLVGAPYVPFTPWILAVPRPVDMEIYYGEPMHFEGTGSEADEHILELVEQVRSRVGELIALGLERRKAGTLDSQPVFPGAKAAAAAGAGAGAGSASAGAGASGKGGAS